MGFIVKSALVNSLNADGLTLKVNGSNASTGTEIANDDNVEVIAANHVTIVSVSYNDDGMTGLDEVDFTVDTDGKRAYTTWHDPYNQGDFYNLAWVADVGELPAPNFAFNSTFLSQHADRGVTLKVNGADAVVGTEVRTGDFVQVISENEYFTNAQWDGHVMTVDVDNYQIAYFDSFPDVTRMFKLGYQLSATEPLPANNYAVKQSLIDSLALNGVTMYVDGVLAEVGTEIPVGSTFQLRTVDRDIISVQSYDPWTGLPIDFVISADKKTATLHPFIDLEGGDFTVSVSVSEVPQPDVKGVNNVYSLTDDQVATVITERFIFYTGGVNQDDFKDYGVFILGLIKLPFIIDPSLVDGDSEVILGDKSTGVVGSAITTDVFTLNLGEIAVIGDRNNLLDYADTVTLLHLPYCDPVVLDINYVMDCTLSVEYVINGYNGVTTVNIYSSKIDGIFESRTVDLNINIPFATVDNAKPSYNSPYDIELGKDNGVLRPYIEVMRNDSYDENGFFNVPILDSGVLNDYVGYVKIDEIELVTSATYDERDMILNSINDGVIIK